MESKQRSKMFSFREVEVISDYMKDHRQELSMKFSSGGCNYNSRRKQELLWQKLVDEVNSVGTSMRTAGQVKEKWRNMIKKAKSEFVADKKSRQQTGGGAPATYSSQATQDIAELMGCTPSFSGIPGTGDCEAGFGRQEYDESLPASLMEGEVDDAFDGLADSDDLDLTPLPVLGGESPGACGDKPLPLKNLPAPSTAPNKRALSRPYKAPSKKTLGYKAPSKTTAAKEGCSKDPAPESKPKTLKQLQMNYYSTAIKVQEAQLLFFQKATNIARAFEEKYGNKL